MVRRNLDLYGHSFQTFGELKSFILENTDNDDFWYTFINQCVNKSVSIWLNELNDSSCKELLTVINKIDYFNTSDSEIKDTILSSLGITTERLDPAPVVQFVGLFDVLGKRIVDEYYPEKKETSIFVRLQVLERAYEKISIIVTVKSGRTVKLPPFFMKSLPIGKTFDIPIKLDEELYGKEIDISIEGVNKTLETCYIGEIDECIVLDVHDYPITLRKVLANCYQIPMVGHYSVYDCEINKESLCVEEFWIATTIVTNRLARLVFPQKLFPGQPNFPCLLSPEEAEQMVEELNILLHDKLPSGYVLSIPRFFQWEIAAMGGHRSENFKYPGSNEASEVGWLKENSDDKLHPVAELKPNEIGLFDMCGNVNEICKGHYEELNMGYEFHGGSVKLPQNYYYSHVDYGNDYLNYCGLRLCLCGEKCLK